jgi:glycosyltransferase involved in cell wall biosynthesis
MSMITELPFKAASHPAVDHSALPHILLVVDQFPEVLGGGERIVLRLASLLPQYGYRTSILTFSIHPASSVLQSETPCPIYVLPLERTYDLRAFRAALELRRFIKQQQIQLVQTFFESSDIWAGFVAKALTSAKLIWSRRDMGILRGRKHEIAYRLMNRAPDAVFAVSDQVRQHCIEVDRIDPGRVQTIYNGLNLSDWENTNTQAASGQAVVSTVGNIRRVKGHDIFVRAAAIVAAQFPDVSFNIAGEVLEPEYFAELETLIRDLGLSDRFHFAGGIKHLREYLAKSDIFVLPSRSEGFSNALVEAMAASLPIVATNVGGNAEAVEDGVNGFLVPSEDVAALAAAMIQLLEDPKRSKAMGEAGRDTALSKFTTEAMMGKIVKTYKTLLAAR